MVETLNCTMEYNENYYNSSRSDVGEPAAQLANSGVPVTRSLGAPPVCASVTPVDIKSPALGISNALLSSLTPSVGTPSPSFSNSSPSLGVAATQLGAAAPQLGAAAPPLGAAAPPLGAAAPPLGATATPLGAVAPPFGAAYHFLYVDEIGPEDSVSQTSHMSNSSNISSESAVERRRLLKAEIAASKIAELRERELDEMQKMANHMHRINKMKMEEEEEEMAIKIKAFKRKVKMEVLQAEMEALEEDDISCVGNFQLAEDNLAHIHERSKPAGYQNPNVSIDNCIKEERPNVDSKIVQQAECLKNNVDQHNSERINRKVSIEEALLEYTLWAQLPKQEIPKFSGNISNYRMFKESFKNQIEMKVRNSSDRLHYLSQYTEAKANSIVKACLNMESSEGYEAAWRLLDRKYGNPEKIRIEYINKILQRTPVTKNNLAELEDFHIELLIAKQSVSNISYGMVELENPKTLFKLVRKLPEDLQKKWRYRAVDLWEKEHRSAKFDDLVHMVERAANAENHPLYGVHLILNNEDDSQPKTESRKVMFSVAKEVTCLYCDLPHRLVNCNKFMSLKKEDRMKILKETRACFRCLEIGHMAKNCVKEVRCEVCRGWHNTVMHGNTRWRTKG